MLTIEQLAIEFGTHNHCIEIWMNELQISEKEIEFTLEHFGREQRRSIMNAKIRPMLYLVEYPWLIEHPNRMVLQDIKDLPSNVYKMHLDQLKLADKIDDKLSRRTFPYNEYTAEVFFAFRNLTKKTELDFVRKMFARSISHSSYPAAKLKLCHMTQRTGYQ